MSENKEANDGLNVPMIVTVGLVSLIVVFALILAIQVLYYNAANTETDRKVTQKPNLAADSLIAQQEAKLARFGWIDKSEGKVVIPIQRAMDLVVRELQDSGYARSDAVERPSGGGTQ